MSYTNHESINSDDSADKRGLVMPTAAERITAREMHPEINVEAVLSTLILDLKGLSAAKQHALLTKKYAKYINSQTLADRTFITLEVTTEYLARLFLPNEMLLKDLITWMHTQTERGEKITQELLHKAAEHHILFGEDGELYKRQIPTAWVMLLENGLS